MKFYVKIILILSITSSKYDLQWFLWIWIFNCFFFYLDKSIGEMCFKVLNECLRLINKWWLYHWMLFIPLTPNSIKRLHGNKREWRENTWNIRIPVRLHVNSIDNHAMGNCVSVKQEFLHCWRFDLQKEKNMAYLCFISISLSYGRKTRIFLKFVNPRLPRNFLHFVNLRFPDNFVHFNSR